jgi:hypothetical protein
MKRELGHFMIGDSYGGNQDWFRTYMMRHGGCGAETACDSSLYFAIHKGVKDIYPFDPLNLSRDDYVEFAHIMEKYLKPRMTGINRAEIYVEGYLKYLNDRKVSDISMDILDGNAPYEKAEAAVMKQIDTGNPVPTLILNHKDKTLKDYVWHWFLINGYDGTDDALMVKTVTYSQYEWVDFKKLWDSGYSSRGGLVLYSVE